MEVDIIARYLERMMNFAAESEMISGGSGAVGSK